jgi:hypothetical protein
MKNKPWIDCSLCEHFCIENDEHGCQLFELLGLPRMFRKGTSKKCCSSFEGPIENFEYPDRTQMEYRVLYFYNPSAPNQLFEDIDL